EAERKNAGNDENKEALEKEIAELRKKVEESESAISKKQESTGSVYGPEDKAHIEHRAGHLTKGGECPVCRQTVSVLPGVRDYMSEEAQAHVKEPQSKKEESNDELTNADKQL